MRSELFKIATSVAILSVVAACSATSENSFLSDNASDPTSHSMSTDPVSTELAMKADSTNLGTITAARYVELSGDCFPSTYPTHRITATVNGTTKSIYDMSNSNTTSMSYGSCKNGRFNVVLTGANMVTGTNKIILTLTGYDSSSVAYSNGNAVTQYTVIRSD